MRQQDDDESVSHHAVFVNPLVSNDDDGGHVWVNMTLAAVE